jgi:DNA helicase-2/ATP-dependent DNA helicase PcrA
VGRRVPRRRGEGQVPRQPRPLVLAEVITAALRGDARDLPQLAGHGADDISDLKERRKRHEQVEELRLAYVAWTRARHHHAVSCWRWAPHLKNGLGPSPYVIDTRDAMETWGGVPERWADVVEKGEANPYADRSVDLPWPMSHHTHEVDRRLAAAELVRAADDPMLDDVLLFDQVQQWDEEIARLLEEAARDRSPETEVPMPASISATALARLRDDPAGFAADRARPMPRRPSPAARFGTRFHAWVEVRFGQQELFDPDDLPGRGDAGIEDDDDLKQVIAAFEAGPFATRPPHRVEAPFALVLAGQVVRGRIDAIYDDTDAGPGHYLVVDWKTNARQTADPLQLAVYRLAWAELCGVPIDQVRAAFYYVRSGDLVEPEGLAGRAELEQVMAPARP